VEFVVDKVALGQVFSPSSSVFPCQFHSTGAPLPGKRQKITLCLFAIEFINVYEPQKEGKYSPSQV
jgi:hypothetical protein